MTKTSVSRVARIVAFNLALMLLLTELVALAAYGWETGSLYYLTPPSGRSVSVDPTGGVEKYRLHPYFGFTNRPSATRRSVVGELTSEPGHANNHGFVSSYDYPYERRHDDEFVVGLFGGSVAANLAVFEQKRRILATRLERVLGLPAGRVTVLNFAVGGYKQPQQWLTYAYFRALGQRLDAVINIDGFNELALAGRNRDAGIELSMPSFDHLKALRDVTGDASSLGSVERMMAIRQAWRKFAIAFNRAWAGESWELTLASGFLANFLVYKYHLRRHRQLLQQHVEETGGDGQNAWLMLEPAPSEVDGAAVERALALWTESSALLGGAQDADAGLYLHFLQPNQYHDTGRVFSEQERAVAFSSESVFADYIRRDYSRWVSGLEALRARGVRAYSLVHLFDPVSDPVYSDDCCHFNDRGQRLLAEAMAERIAEAHSDGRVAGQ